MAVIKYQINGKADTKPIKDTEKAVQGMFNKIQTIDNTLKAFVGVKVFSEVNKAIKGALAEYDKFQASLNGENNFTKQFDRINTAMAGTIGTVRDELFKVVGDITGKDGFQKLEETIPKIGAALIASFKASEAIVANIKDNFDELLKPAAWNDFFSHAGDLTYKFCVLFGNTLRDAFSYAIDFLKWSLNGLNIFKILWGNTASFYEEFMNGLKRDTWKKFHPEDDSEDDNKGDSKNFPALSISEDTKRSFSDFNESLGKTLGAALGVIAPPDIKGIFDAAYGEHHAQLKATIADMQEARTGDGLAAQLAALIAKLKPEATNAVSAAGNNFSDATSNINKLLYDATAEQAEKVRGKMEGLNKQFNAATERIAGLFDELEKAKDTKEAENAFKKINDQVKKINDLSESMDKLKEIIEGVKFDSLGQKLGAELGEKLKRVGESIGAGIKAFGQDPGGVIKSKLLGVVEAVKSVPSNLWEGIKGAWNNLVEGAKGLWDKISHPIETLKGIGEKVGAALGNIGEAMGGAGELLGQVLGNIVNLFGDASAAINAIFTGNPLGLIINLISRLFETFAKISGPFAAFMNIFDVFFDVIEEICSALGPALDAIFMPILDIVRQLAIIFGMFLNALSPILSLVGLVASAIKLLSPILYGIAYVFAAVADGFATVYNAVSSIVKGLTFGWVNMGHKDTDNREKLEKSWNAEMNYDRYQNSNNSTSYNVSGDMYININFSHSFVNGDTREIALMLRDEIRLVEGAGY
jgi:phage-related protein